MKPPREDCPRHGEMQPIDRASYYEYICPKCDCSVKNYKPAKLLPGEKKRFGPEK